MLRTQLAAVVVAALAAGTAAADFIPPSLATPLPPGPGRVGRIRNSPLAAPTITHIGVKHGTNRFEVVPAGWERKPFKTKNPWGVPVYGHRSLLGK